MFVNKGKNKVERPETLNKDDALSVEYLVMLMDNPDVKFDYLTPEKDSVIGGVYVFVRSLYGNYVLADENTKEISLIRSADNEKLPEGMTLNDYVLFKCAATVRKVYEGTDDRLLALNAFPTPFGVVHSSDRNCDMAVIQLCVNVEQLLPSIKGMTYVPVEEAKIPDYIRNHFKFTKEDKLWES